MSDALKAWIKQSPITQTTTSGADAQSYLMDDTVAIMDDASALMGGPTSPSNTRPPRVIIDKPRIR
jgi:hypothetical protein